MKLAKNITAIDLALYLTDIDLLIITDVHLGYEEALQRRGMLLPKYQYKETKMRMEKILAQVKPKKILINGDLKHEFGSIISTEWKKGNHDTILEPITRKKDIELIPYYTEKEYFICHGDKIFDNDEIKKSKTIIIGNEHPAITLSENGRNETYKCFIVGKYEKKQLIVLPSFNVLVEGSNILREERLSPYVPKDVGNFHVYIVGDQIYDFGNVKDI